MFTVKTKDGELKVKFHHQTVGDNRGTDCRIHNDDYSIDVVGHALCHPNDNFDRRVGRKIALTHVLQLFTEDRDVRKMFWKEYLKTNRV